MIIFYGRQYNGLEPLGRVLSGHFGIGFRRSHMLVLSCGVPYLLPLNELTVSQLSYLEDCIRQNYQLDADLKRFVSACTFRKYRSGSYRGLRLAQGLPCRGQRTRSNSSTACKNKVNLSST